MSRRGPKNKPNNQSLSYGVDIASDKHYPFPLTTDGLYLNVSNGGFNSSLITLALERILNEMKKTNLYLAKISDEFFTERDIDDNNN